ncbi:unnamed protein product [Caenorhabditis bovis]|uniref:Uncharacterized protein n=1 Tax=Caenorhabditis bovis TaxID=2654633 RepID=A0A8S1FG20_9PELO|nr:unnamed protein product [Caenorhabditis bovis]
MNTKILIGLVVVCAFVAYSEASVGQQLAKVGERVEIEIAKGAKALARTTKAGKQIFNFSGPNAGVFVDEKGKKIDSSNYELKKDVLIIKKATAADSGAYEKEPNPPVGHTPGAVLQLTVQ